MKPFRFASEVVKDNRLIYFLVIFLMISAGIIDGFGVTLIIPLFQLILNAGGSSGLGESSDVVMNYIVKIFELLHLPLESSFVLIFIFAIFMLKAAFLVLERSITGIIIFRFQKELRKSIFTKIMNARWDFFLNQKAGHIANILSNECRRAGEAFSFFNNFLVQLISILVYISIAMAISVKLTIFAAGTGFLLMYVLKGMVKRAQHYGEKTSKLNSELHIHTLESIGGAKYIKSTSSEQFFIKLFNGINKKLAKTGYKLSIAYAILKNSYEPVMVGVLCLIIFSSFFMFQISSTSLVLLAALFYRIYSKLSETQHSYQSMVASIPGYTMGYDLIKEADILAEISCGEDFVNLSEGIQLENITFSYDNKRNVLNDVSIKIDKGKITALIGKTGSGKTTIVDLILGLLEAQEGRILIDNKELNNYKIKSWRDKTGYVSQETLLFNDTIYNNIVCDQEGLTEEDVLNAAKTAFAHDFIEIFPEGYNTIIGDRGVKLSGGQRQRIALARALARKPEILFLDEATSALDNESELMVKKAIENLREDITIVIIAHRLTSILEADKIIVLDEGKIIEQGNAEELNLKKGLFYKLKNINTEE